MMRALRRQARNASNMVEQAVVVANPGQQGPSPISDSSPWDCRVAGFFLRVRVRIAALIATLFLEDPLPIDCGIEANVRGALNHRPRPALKGHPHAKLALDGRSFASSCVTGGTAPQRSLLKLSCPKDSQTLGNCLVTVDYVGLDDRR
jgi:hypothetical protein